MKQFFKLKIFLPVSFLLFSTIGHGLEVCDAAKLKQYDLEELQKILNERFDSKIKSFYKEISGFEIKTEDYYLRTELSVDLDSPWGPPYSIKAKFNFFLKTQTGNVLSTYYIVPAPEHPSAEIIYHGGEVGLEVGENYIRDWEGLPLKKSCVIIPVWHDLSVTIYNRTKENYAIGRIELFDYKEQIMSWNMPLSLVE